MVSPQASTAKYGANIIVRRSVNLLTFLNNMLLPIALIVATEKLHTSFTYEAIAHLKWS
jgi:hypothetical protein